MRIATHWLKDYVKPRASVDEMAVRLTMAGLEVKKQDPARKGVVFETEITSNRPDWLSYIGVARELATLFSTPLIIPKSEAPGKLSSFPEDFKVEIKDANLCPFYTATILRGIKPCATPDYMKECLELAGLRSINFLVDVTNFVLLECGQPLHAFDLNLLKGAQIMIRRAKAGESITAIDAKTYSLTAGDLIIADGENPVAIAGVMGGKGSEVNAATTDILLESAFFDPATVRSTSKRLGISTDSSYRFERRVDPEGVLWARERVISLILENTQVAEITRVKLAGKKPAKIKTVQLTYEKLERLLGARIAPAEVNKILKNLGLTIVGKNQKGIRVTAPSFRADITQAVDLVEEVARIYGYSRILETLPTLATLPSGLRPHVKFEIMRRVTDELAGAGFYEIQNYSIIQGAIYDKFFEKKDALVRVNNPQNRELNLMRPSLMPGLLETAQRNQHRGNKYYKFFEVGQVYFAKGKDLPTEKLTLGFAAFGKPEKNWALVPRPVSLFDIKGAVELLLEKLGIQGWGWQETQTCWTETGICLELKISEKSLGFVGEASSMILKQFDIEGPLVVGEIDLEGLIPLTTKERKFEVISKYPAAIRDMSLLVPKTLAQESVRRTILETGNQLLKDARLFDVYEGKNLPAGVKSLAFTLEYQSLERTLSSEEVQAEHMRIAQVLQDKYNAQLPQAK